MYVYIHRYKVTIKMESNVSHFSTYSHRIKRYLIKILHFFLFKQYFCMKSTLSLDKITREDTSFYKEEVHKIWQVFLIPDQMTSKLDNTDEASMP